MCDERERLIDYLYGEASGADRAEVERHLADCHVCRAEIGGLRGVREDLLAWDVPAHEPIWRPVAPAPPPSSWKTTPSWGMLAAAAALVFAAGLGGGVASRVIFKDPAATAAIALTQPLPATSRAEPTPVSTAITASDLSRLETALLERMKQEMDTRFELVSSRDTARQQPRPQTVSATQVASMTRQLEELQRWKAAQIRLNVDLHQQIGRLSTTTSRINDDFEFSRLQRVSMLNPGGAR